LGIAEMKARFSLLIDEITRNTNKRATWAFIWPIVMPARL
jgi:hypothetical protein